MPAYFIDFQQESLYNKGMKREINRIDEYEMLEDTTTNEGAEL